MTGAPLIWPLFKKFKSAVSILKAEARMRVKRETREQARQHRYTLLEKRVEVVVALSIHGGVGNLLLQF